MSVRFIRVKEYERERECKQDRSCSHLQPNVRTDAITFALFYSLEASHKHTSRGRDHTRLRIARVRIIGVHPKSQPATLAEETWQS